MPSILRVPRVTFARLLSNAIVGQQEMRKSQFEVVGPIETDVVFLGDSITEYGLWSEWFPGLASVNRGVAGDTTLGVLRRLPSAIGAQRLLSLLIGTNDLSLGTSPATVAQNIQEIVKTIKVLTPNTRIVLNSVMPRTKAYRDQIIDLNTRLEVIARHSGIMFLDTWRELASQDGTLRAELSTDHLHLNGLGYQEWTNKLSGYLD
jgi:lysophospholipase L1-like esterase